MEKKQPWRIEEPRARVHLVGPPGICEKGSGAALSRGLGRVIPGPPVHDYRHEGELETPQIFENQRKMGAFVEGRDDDPQERPRGCLSVAGR